MIAQFYTNHTFNATVDSHIEKNKMDELEKTILKQATNGFTSSTLLFLQIDYTCNRANATKVHEVMERNKENREIAKELLGEITTEERFNLKDWILVHDMESITEFMLEKMIVRESQRASTTCSDLDVLRESKQGVEVAGRLYVFLRSLMIAVLFWWENKVACLCLQ